MNTTRSFIHRLGALLSPGCLRVWEAGAWHAEWHARGKAYASGSGTSEDAALDGLADEMVKQAGAQWLWDLRHGDAVHGEQIRCCLEEAGYATDFDEVVLLQAGRSEQPPSGEVERCVRRVGGGDR